MTVFLAFTRMLKPDHVSRNVVACLGKNLFKVFASTNVFLVKLGMLTAVVTLHLLTVLSVSTMKTGSVSLPW